MANEMNTRIDRILQAKRIFGREQRLLGRFLGELAHSHGLVWKEHHIKEIKQLHDYFEFILKVMVQRVLTSGTKFSSMGTDQKDKLREGFERLLSGEHALLRDY
ncbi:MAG: hypothetical protein ABIC95_05855 [archaeon]